MMAWEEFEQAALERILLKKLKMGLLDGVIGPDITREEERLTYRKMIVEGVPYFIHFPMGEAPTRENVVEDGHFETEEMKLWFLHLNGGKMQDPDAQAYSAPGWSKKIDGENVQKKPPVQVYYRVQMTQADSGSVVKVLEERWLYRKDAEGYIKYCREKLEEAARILRGSGLAYTEPDAVRFAIVEEEGE